MSRHQPTDPLRLRDEIALSAARMIAEDGADYATAKRKAARQILGDTRVGGEWMPDNETIEAGVREYQALFQGERQPRILRLLRRLAVLAMEELAPFRPYLAGAVLNGTASQHSDIHLQAFCDSPKDVAVYLLNAGIDFDTVETPHLSGRGDVETLSFLWRGQWPQMRETRALAEEIRAELGSPVGIHIALYDADDIRRLRRLDASGRPNRATRDDVCALLEGPEATESHVSTDSPV